jgi:hypothetical protein
MNREKETLIKELRRIHTRPYGLGDGYALIPLAEDVLGKAPIKRIADLSIEELTRVLEASQIYEKTKSGILEMLERTIESFRAENRIHEVVSLQTLRAKIKNFT